MPYLVLLFISLFALPAMAAEQPNEIPVKRIYCDDPHPEKPGVRKVIDFRWGHDNEYQVDTADLKFSPDGSFQGLSAASTLMQSDGTGFAYVSCGAAYYLPNSLSCALVPLNFDSPLAFNLRFICNSRDNGDQDELDLTYNNGRLSYACKYKRSGQEYKVGFAYENCSAVPATTD